MKHEKRHLREEQRPPIESASAADEWENELREHDRQQRIMMISMMVVLVLLSSVMCMAIQYDLNQQERRWKQERDRLQKNMQKTHRKSIQQLQEQTARWNTRMEQDLENWKTELDQQYQEDEKRQQEFMKKLDAIHTENKDAIDTLSEDLERFEEKMMKRVKDWRAEMERKINERINEFRREHGLPTIEEEEDRWRKSLPPGLLQPLPDWFDEEPKQPEKPREEKQNNEENEKNEEREREPLPSPSELAVRL